MISKGNIQIGFDKGARLLKEFNLLEELNFSKKMVFESTKFSKEFIKISQDEDYKKIFDIAIKKRDYDILLNDDSFFQFSYTEKGNKIIGVRYAFYEAPYEVLNYYEYIKEIGFGYEEVGEELREEYEQYYSEATLKKQTVPIRYDYEDKGSSLIHSKSHIHIGHGNDIRIPCNKIIRPEVFIWFIIRHIYFSEYKKKICDFQKQYLEDIKINSNSINVFLENEEKDMYFKI